MTFIPFKEGTPGPKGEKGDQGDQGDKGDNGDDGLPGAVVTSPIMSYKISSSGDVVFGRLYYNASGFYQDFDGILHINYKGSATSVAIALALASVANSIPALAAVAAASLDNETTLRSMTEKTTILRIYTQDLQNEIRVQVTSLIFQTARVVVTFNIVEDTPNDTWLSTAGTDIFLAFLVQTPDIEIGTITSVPNSQSPSATITGTSLSPRLNLTLQAGPSGPSGTNGNNGIDGITPTVSVGAVHLGDAGTDPIVTNTGSSTGAVFNFTIPKGDQGDKGDDATTDELNAYKELVGTSLTTDGLLKDLNDLIDSNESIAATNAANSALAASTSATNAATSATNASGSASAAATSATNAATSETNAATSESNASGSASAAATSETNAATSATNAANSASTITSLITDAYVSSTDFGNGIEASQKLATLDFMYDYLEDNYRANIDTNTNDIATIGTSVNTGGSQLHLLQTQISSYMIVSGTITLTRTSVTWDGVNIYSGFNFMTSSSSKFSLDFDKVTITASFYGAPSVVITRIDNRNAPTIANITTTTFDIEWYWDTSITFCYVCCGPT